MGFASTTLPRSFKSDVFCSYILIVRPNSVRDALPHLCLSVCARNDLFDLSRRNEITSLVQSPIWDSYTSRKPEVLICSFFSQIESGVLGCFLFDCMIKGPLKSPSLRLSSGLGLIFLNMLLWDYYGELAHQWTFSRIIYYPTLTIQSNRQVSPKFIEIVLEGLGCRSEILWYRQQAP